MYSPAQRFIAQVSQQHIRAMRSFLFLLAVATPAAAFVPSQTSRVHSSPSTVLSASSQDVDEPSTKRRDLLSSSLAAFAAISAPLTASAIETYLTEPTDEFKESERQRMEFRKKQLVAKGEFVRVLAHLTTEASTEEELISDLKELRKLTVDTEGLPLGIKKEEMYKVIRSKKAKGFWPTNVEIA